MWKIFLLTLLCLWANFWESSSKSVNVAEPPYTPDWKSLDKRPLPTWYDDAKFGIFIHWGLYSVPSFGSEWFWYNWIGRKYPEYAEFVNKTEKPGFQYADYADRFTAEFYEPNDWADLFKKSGAKYVVLTSKHHEGFTMWPSNYSWNWNAMDLRPHRDLVGDLAKAVRAKNLTFGLYYSQFEWFHPLFNQDEKAHYTTNEYVRTVAQPQLQEIVHQYKPDVIWSDGAHGSPEYWNATNFIAWLYNDSPVKKTVVVNDRWGSGAGCKHGDFWTCHDGYNPKELQHHKWESCLTIYKGSWAYDRRGHIGKYRTSKDLLNRLAEAISCGGNLLLDVGPTHDGRIVPIFEERLLAIGDFLKVNSEAVYGTKPWQHQNDTLTPNVWYTAKKSDNITLAAYAFFFKWPANNKLKLGSPKSKPDSKVHLLGVTDQLKITVHGDDYLEVDLSPITFTKMPNPDAWVLKFENLVQEADID